MGWDRVIGQHRVKALLKRAVASGQIAHAYLFEGSEGVGKDALALEFAKVLNCREKGSEACGQCESCRRMETLQHPNVRIITALPSGKGETSGDDPLKGFTDEQMESIKAELAAKARDPYHRISVPKANFIKVNSVREIRRQASLTASHSGRKVFVMFNADEMNAEASNSLLKTLEEPPGETVLLLTTARREQLLATILSRCQVIHCEPLNDEEIGQALVDRDGIREEEASVIARLANGSFGASRMLASEDMLRMRGEVIQFVRLALGKSPVALLAHLETLLSGRERTDAERWLRLLQVWIHDALALRAEGSEASQTAGDDLRRFVERFPRADLLAASSSVERSIALLGKNVYLPLVFTTLALDLQHSISSPDA
ncbi:MAG: DNA polymerase III subunit delta' [Bacteroidota bacterium]